MDIRIVTLNVWMGGILFNEIISFLQEQNADVVLLQEAHNGTDPSLKARFRTMQELKSRLGFEHDDFAPAFRDFDLSGGKSQRGNGILSKFPIKKRANIFLSGEYSEVYRDVPGNYKHCPRNLQYVVLDTPAGDIDLFNLQGVWDLDGDNFSPQRQRMSQVIIKAVKDKPNVVLGGDTNAKPTNQAIINIEEHLKNVFGHELTTTFNMKRKDNPGYATAVVDMLLVSPQIKVLSHSCPEVDISDHLPLAATFQVPSDVLGELRSDESE